MKGNKTRDGKRSGRMSETKAAEGAGKWPVIGDTSGAICGIKVIDTSLANIIT